MYVVLYYNFYLALCVAFEVTWLFLTGGTDKDFQNEGR